MGETLQPVTTSFNRSLRIEHRPERLTGDPGAVVLREVLERSGIMEWMMPQLRDPRRQEDVVHDLASLTCDEHVSEKLINRARLGAGLLEHAAMSNCPIQLRRAMRAVTFGM